MITPLNKIAPPAVLLCKNEKAKLIDPSSLPTRYEEVACRYLSDDILIDARKRIYKLACDEEKYILTSALLGGKSLPIDITDSLTTTQVDEIVNNIDWENPHDQKLFDDALKQSKS